MDLAAGEAGVVIDGILGNVGRPYDRRLISLMRVTRSSTAKAQLAADLAAFVRGRTEATMRLWRQIGLAARIRGQAVTTPREHRGKYLKHLQWGLVPEEWTPVRVVMRQVPG
ncbi:hypothetical protein PUR34_09545 [Streptomyces sp. JV185]|uniref:hypothetical protein n=1 Tax=Streptomyces sp. JV185 TaxID=858638 RepID=UPI002E7902C9|nr:hypothetical protein [Streptomyces sp. JV185]MEE1768401.1 hypothetical protein [Streptomyces sp. JV185]